MKCQIVRDVIYERVNTFLVLVSTLSDEFVSNFDFRFQQIPIEVVAVHLQKLGHNFTFLLKLIFYISGLETVYSLIRETKRSIGFRDHMQAHTLNMGESP